MMFNCIMCEKKYKPPPSKRTIIGKVVIHYIKKLI